MSAALLMVGPSVAVGGTLSSAGNTKCLVPLGLMFSDRLSYDAMSEFLYDEARSILCGERLGQGTASEVFLLKPNPDFVVKLEITAQSFQNVAEWEIWSYVRGNPMERWFAPCKMISDSGTMLIQRRVQPLRLHELPKRIPEFLCDLKPENFGLLDGRFVCSDYGTMVRSLSLASKRLVKAEWRGV
ncbi:hypothetical protein ACRQ5Q_08330 [Bradyrhizobium sp. PMVTL-01]|uniref:hypothetical protein n=1 Tax=Bradyrhizobium sp. PMVTL-01 TaxID=3434999 RepID=UPI003F72ABE4